MQANNTYEVNAMKRFMEQAFSACGVPVADGQIVSDNLLYAELRGIKSHGISRFPIYLRRIQKGAVNPQPKIAIEQRALGILGVDGDNGLGAVGMVHALNRGMEQARQVGICVIGMKGSNHFGASGYYCQLAAEQGFVSIVLTDAPPATPPWGGKEAYFGTNPIAFGLPRAEKPHIIVDLATSLVARGKIIRAAAQGEEIPKGWALDKEGFATTDPQAALAGVLLPMAGAKGYALSLAVEHLAGVLVGAGFGKEVAWQYGEGNKPANVGHFVILVKADAFLTMETYHKRVEHFVEEIKQIPLAPGYQEIKLPGEREWEQEQSSVVQGVTLDEDMLATFQAIAQELNIKL
ncbi:malate/lactate dehydrogenase [Desulfitobacterium dichloroeliminans LMG P-21439]|uniref:Malate/lactate dehydrogenase n=1 Tax=Desulfitobacterium dichloroeliminans (strain LMG P-21439 / DCA1) TaxID=871963 RepID=L0F5S4_DESDL|nr:Ldh family oxidoreductase [Desulfitobacterium dichloroeliminans]AGA68313.1 malate/lactate dehydrogenase [Desulfitobacterium dichloroeliminans LMG P-21439]